MVGGVVVGPDEYAGPPVACATAGSASAAVAAKLTIKRLIVRRRTRFPTPAPRPDLMVPGDPTYRRLPVSARLRENPRRILSLSPSVAAATERLRRRSTKISDSRRSGA